MKKFKTKKERNL